MPEQARRSMSPQSPTDSTDARMEVQALINHMSRRFLELETASIDTTIDEMLAALGRSVGAASANLFQVGGGGATMINTHHWRSPDAEPLRRLGWPLPMDRFPWGSRRLRSLETIVVPESGVLPSEASAERKLLQGLGIGALVATPLVFGGRLTGFVAVGCLGESRTWAENELHLFSMGADILANALEHHQNRKRLRRLNRALETLGGCNEVVFRAGEELDMLQRVCTVITDTGGYRFAWAGYAEHDPDKTVRPVAQAGYGRNYLQTIRVSWSGEDPRGRGPVGCAIRQGSPTITRDLRSDPGFEPWRAEAVKRGYSSVIALPLRHSGKVIGALAIYAQEADAFDGEEVKLLGELAEDVSFGIHALRTRTEKHAAESVLRLRNRAMEMARNGIVILDAGDLTIIYANPAFERISGYRNEELLGKRPDFLRDGDDNQPELEEIRFAVRTRQQGKAVLRNYRKDGSLFWNEFSIAPVRDASGEVTHFVGIVNDITKHKRYEEQLEYQAHYDELTGLANRNLMNDRLRQALAYAQRYGRAAAVLFVDLDRFKLINESLGHPAGDRVLRLAAAAIEGCAREGDTVARYGGDEFVVVLNDVGDPEEVAKFAERALEAVANPFPMDGQELVVSASIGAALYPKDSRDAEALLKHADAAMHRVKQDGRGGFGFFTAELNELAVQRLTLEAELRRAIEDDELLLFYQPQVDLGTGRIVGMEALVRWAHPTRGLLSPGEFIPLAEESGLIIPLGNWVLNEACRRAARWQAAGLRDTVVAVNVSARQLEAGGFVDAVAGAIERSGADPALIELELTESTVMADPDQMVERLNGLKARGVKLALDDFGTGFSSLSHLKRFPFDRLKIDQSFTRHVIDDPHDSAIALTIIAMARRMGLGVIAEGVETESQLRYLQRRGCEQAQGFFLARPLTAEAATALLQEGEFPVVSEWQSRDKPALLVVDDNPRVTAAIARALRREHCSVHTLNDPHEAFEMMARQPVQVVLSDHHMPGMSGIEMLSRIRELYPETIRLVLSGDTDPRLLAQAVNRGWVYKWLTKPWSEQELVREIRAAFREYERVGEISLTHDRADEP